jgi:hypothetical protein
MPPAVRRVEQELAARRQQVAPAVRRVEQELVARRQQVAPAVAGQG